MKASIKCAFQRARPGEIERLTRDLSFAQRAPRAESLGKMRNRLTVDDCEAERGFAYARAFSPSDLRFARQDQILSTRPTIVGLGGPSEVASLTTPFRLARTHFAIGILLLLAFVTIGPAAASDPPSLRRLVYQDIGAGEEWVAVKLRIPEPGRFSFTVSMSFASGGASSGAPVAVPLLRSPSQPAVAHLGFLTPAGREVGLSMVVNEGSDVAVHAPVGSEYVPLPGLSADRAMFMVSKAWPTTGTIWAYAFVGGHGDLSRYELKLSSTVPVEVLEILRGVGVTAVDDTGFTPSSDVAAASKVSGVGEPSFIPDASWMHESSRGLTSFVFSRGTGHTTWEVDGPAGSMDAWQSASFPRAELTEQLAPDAETYPWHYPPVSAEGGEYTFRVSDRVSDRSFVVAAADIPELRLS